MILLMKYPKMGLIMSVDSSLARIGFGDIYADLDQLRDSASFGVANQNHKNCEKIADDICSLAVSYRLKIFDTIRSNKNINHPAKDVINPKLINLKSEMSGGMIALKIRTVHWINLSFPAVGMAAS